MREKVKNYGAVKKLEKFKFRDVTVNNSRIEEQS